MADTYGAPYPDGTISQGGFASHVRAHEYFIFKIPHNTKAEHAAPMLCAGLTTYSPLLRLGCGPGKKVGIVGLSVYSSGVRFQALADLRTEGA